MDDHPGLHVFHIQRTELGTNRVDEVALSVVDRVLGELGRQEPLNLIIVYQSVPGPCQFGFESIDPFLRSRVVAAINRYPLFPG
jgi:hypothetical protein